MLLEKDDKSQKVVPAQAETTHTVKKPNKEKRKEKKLEEKNKKFEKEKEEAKFVPAQKVEKFSEPPITIEKINDLLQKAKKYYYGSNGVLKDYSKAEKLFIEAAKEDSAEAFRFLGVMYLFGNGVVVDKDLAAELLLKATELGDNRAKELYACYITDSEKMKYKIENLPSYDFLNVREQPLSTTATIDKLDGKIGVITILDQAVNNDGTKWSKIKYCRNGVPNYGWVASRYLVPAYASYKVAKRYRVINVKRNDTLNMRFGPGSQYKKIGEIPANAKDLTLEQCKLSTKGGRWCKVKYKANSGWVSALYIQEQ
jgi:uncharacterized protein YgiM (DUF1202 family)